MSDPRAPLQLALVWHMHQPDYVDPGSGERFMPWTRLHAPPDAKPNRVFCSTMGAATDLLDESFRRLVVNAVLWGFELEVPERADVRFVDPYSPSPYAFKGYRRGLTPADHALGKTLRAGTPVPAAPRKKP